MREASFFHTALPTLSGWHDRMIARRCHAELVAARRVLADLAVDWAECRMGIAGSRLRFEQTRARARGAMAALETKGFVRGRVGPAVHARHFDMPVQADQARILDSAFPGERGDIRFDPMEVMRAGARVTRDRARREPAISIPTADPMQPSPPPVRGGGRALEAVVGA